MNDERWVAERLRALDSGVAFEPRAGVALAGLRRRERRRRVWERGWMWSAGTVAAGVLTMLALPGTATCAMVGVGCKRPVAMPVLLAPAAVVSSAKPVVAVNYKESGSPKAPVVCEIYTDYECPACAAFYGQVFPQMVAEFVKTGKVRVVHRDFPLPQHAHSRLAARYANAAGELGHYDAVVNQLFSTQREWAANGNVDAAVAQVLTAETMGKVRELVAGDPRLDATVAEDLRMVGRDQVNQTPTIVFVHGGVRQKVAGVPSLELLRRYLAELPAK